MPHAKVIVNPIAGGNRRARNWVNILALLRDVGLNFDYELTGAPGHAWELAKAATTEGYSRVISIGGDGTLNEIVNGIYEAGGLNQIELGVINTGIGGDFVRDLGIPHDPKRACRHLMNGNGSLIDLGIVECLSNGRKQRQLFVNFAAVGLAAEVVKTTNARFKRYGGRLAYLIGILSRVLHYENSQVWVTVDGECRKVRVCSIFIHNGRYGGGGMLLAPGAKLTDQFFDMIEIGDLGRFELVRCLPRVYRGTHLAHPKVSNTVAKEISIDSEQKLLVQADGNLVGETPATFTILPSALTVIA